MDKKYLELYQRVQNFSLDDPEAMLPFSQKLARENRWTAQYSQRVMDEYKKFMVLAATVNHHVTPSEQVDQAWHLHLTYTHAYWHKFCAEILQKPIHHCPTLGGRSEHDKFYHWYSATLASYERVFGQPPPADIWPSPAVRIDAGKGAIRIDYRDYWLIKKPSFQPFKPALILPGLLQARRFLRIAAPLSRLSPLRLSATALFLSIMALSLYPVIPLIAASGAMPSSQLSTTTSFLPIDSIGRDWRVQSLLALSALFFLIGVGQFIRARMAVRKPVFDSPAGHTKFKTRYNASDIKLIAVNHLAERAFLNSCIILSSSLLLLLPPDFHSIVVIICLVCVGSLFVGENEAASRYYSASRKQLDRLKDSRGSIRPLCCRICGCSLQELSGKLPLEDVGCSRPQIVAAELNGVEIQVWHCARCYPEVSRDSVHVYELGSGQRYDTANCPRCQARTMRITHKTRVPSAVNEWGEGVKISTCACCGRKDEESYAILPDPPPDPPGREADNDWGCGVCGL